MKHSAVLLSDRLFNEFHNNLKDSDLKEYAALIPSFEYADYFNPFISRTSPRNFDDLADSDGEDRYFAYIASVIGFGKNSKQDMLTIYNAYYRTDITVDDVDWEN